VHGDGSDRRRRDGRFSRRGKVGIRDGEVIRERILRSCEAHRRGRDSRGNERIGASNLDSIAAMGLQWR